MCLSMKKKIFMVGMFGILFSITSCASMYADRRLYNDCLLYDDDSYREGKVVATLVVNGVYKKSGGNATISVAYLLIDNEDVVIMSDNLKRIKLPFSKEEAKIIMMHNNNQCVEVIYHYEE